MNTKVAPKELGDEIKVSELRVKFVFLLLILKKSNANTFAEIFTVISSILTLNCPEFQQIGKALLPSPVIINALPPAVDSIPEPATTDNTVQKAVAGDSKVETDGKATPEINSVPKTEVKAESLPGFSKSLSPYPYVIITSTALGIL